MIHSQTFTEVFINLPIRRKTSFASEKDYVLKLKITNAKSNPRFPSTILKDIRVRTFTHDYPASLNARFSKNHPVVWNSLLNFESPHDNCINSFKMWPVYTELLFDSSVLLLEISVEQLHCDLQLYSISFGNYCKTIPDSDTTPFIVDHIIRIAKPQTQIVQRKFDGKLLKSLSAIRFCFLSYNYASPRLGLCTYNKSCHDEFVLKTNVVNPENSIKFENLPVEILHKIVSDIEISFRTKVISSY